MRYVLDVIATLEKGTDLDGLMDFWSDLKS